MIYSKTPLDYEQLIEMLKERGLIIADEQKAIEYLKVISYFRLANYFRPMERDKENHLYKPNSYFDNAIDLYYFDKKLRGHLKQTLGVTSIFLCSYPECFFLLVCSQKVSQPFYSPDIGKRLFAYLIDEAICFGCAIHSCSFICIAAGSCAEGIVVVFLA